MALACCAPAAHGQQWSNELTAFFETQAHRDGVSVAALAVTTGDSILYVHTIGGVKDVDPFVIGSLSKAVTATAVIRLHRQGLIDLAASAAHYLPDHRSNATVRELLNHRSGFVRSDGFQSVSAGGRIETGPSGPRGNFAYSNVNYALLGRILEKVTNRPYAEVIEDEVFGPLGMNRSSADPDAMVGLTRGKQTWFWWDVEAPYAEPEPDQVPAGFIQMSLRDLALFVQEHVREGSGSGLGLSPEDFALLHRSPVGEEARGYAMGWVVDRLTETRSLQHSGQNDAYSSMMVALPDEDLGVLLLTASNSFTARNHLMGGALRIVRGESVGTYRPIERYLRLLALAALLLGLGSFLRHAVSWVRRGFPRRWGKHRRVIILVLRLAVVGALVLGIPRLVNVPLGDLPQLQPDLGLALLGGAVLGGLEAFVRHWVDSAPD